MNARAELSRGASIAGPRFAFGGLIGVGIFAALVLAFVFVIFDEKDSPDGREYIALGRSLADRGELRLPTGEWAKRPPLYPALIAGLMRSQGTAHWRNSLLAIQAFLAWCTAMLLAALAQRIAGWRAGLISGLAACLYAPFLNLAASVLCETLLIFLFTLAVVIYLWDLDRNVRSKGRTAVLLVVSVLLGLCALTRTNAALLLWVFTADAAIRASSTRHKATHVAMVLVPALLMVGGWGLRNRERLGEWTLSSIGGLNLYLGNCEQYRDDAGLLHADYGAYDRLRKDGLSELAADRALGEQARRFVREHPAECLGNVVRKFRVWLGANVTVSAPTLALLVAVLLTAAANGLRAREGGKPIVIAAVIATGIIVIYWIAVLRETNRPWVSPLHVVPLGIVSLVSLQFRWFDTASRRVGTFFAGLIASQLLVAVVYIPLVRIRWTVDGLLIVAIGVAVARFCEWVEGRREIVRPVVSS